jgi:hypothetical protein
VGWRLVNHWKYMKLRNMEQKREADRKRIADKRSKNKDVAIVSQGVANVAHSDSDLNKDKETTTGAVALPAWVPQDAWEAWLEVRGRIRAPNTKRALAIALKDLDRYRGEGCDPRAVLEAATVKGWRGLFPVKPQTPAVKYDA